MDSTRLRDNHGFHKVEGQSWIPQGCSLKWCLYAVPLHIKPDIITITCFHSQGKWYRGQSWILGDSQPYLHKVTTGSVIL